MHIYFLKDKYKKIIYIGKTYSLDRRFNQHKNEKKWWNEVYTCFYADCKNNFELSIYEKYYITKYKPKYNISLINYPQLSFDLPELIFTEYYKLKLHQIKSFKQQNKELNAYKNRLYEERDMLKDMLKADKDRLYKEKDMLKNDIDRLYIKLEHQKELYRNQINLLSQNCYQNHRIYL